MSLPESGWKSRKLAGYAFTSLLICAIGGLLDPAKLGEVIFGLVSVYTIFAGSAVGRDLVSSLAASRTSKATPTPPKPPAGEEEGS